MRTSYWGDISRACSRTSTKEKRSSFGHTGSEGVAKRFEGLHAWVESRTSTVVDKRDPYLCFEVSGRAADIITGTPKRAKC